MVSSRSSQADIEGAYCPMFHHTVEVIGRRWTGVILLAILSGVERFSDIRDAIPGLSDRLLAQRLRELEAEGLIERSEDGSQVRYHLSEPGRDLSPIVEAINVWSGRWTTAEKASSEISSASAD